MLNLTQKYKNNFDKLMINFDHRTNTELINKYVLKFMIICII